MSDPFPYYSTVPSPLGEVTVTGSGGAVTGVYLPSHAQDAVVVGDRDDAALEQATTELAEYFAGRRRDFTVAVRSAGTEFQQQVWGVLRRIPYGETWSYAKVASELGRPTASRAVGAANGKNPVSIIVPCHRVVGADGSLTGYAGGVPAKRWLLNHETTPPT